MNIRLRGCVLFQPELVDGFVSFVLKRPVFLVFLVNSEILVAYEMYILAVYLSHRRGLCGLMWAEAFWKMIRKCKGVNLVLKHCQPSTRGRANTTALICKHLTVTYF
jgi:hypothetical protein